MTLYIDKDNLEYLLTDTEKNEDFENVMRLLKEHLDISFNFTKEQITGRLAGPIKLLLSRFTSGRGHLSKPEFLPNLQPPRPLQNDYFEHIADKKRSVFLIKDDNAYEIGSRGKYLLGGLGEEVSLLKPLFYNGSYDFDKILLNKSDLKSWEDIKVFRQPIADLIIQDRFAFNNDQALIEHNLIGILSSLLHNNKAKINLVLLINRPDPDKYPFFKDFDNVKKLLNETVKNITGFEPNLTVIWTERTVIEERHDRHIFTNYVWYNPGDSLCFFNTTGKCITKSDKVDVKGLVKFDNRRGADHIIGIIQAKIDELYASGYGHFIQGDKASNFLKFK